MTRDKLANFIKSLEPDQPPSMRIYLSEASVVESLMRGRAMTISEARDEWQRFKDSPEDHRGKIVAGWYLPATSES